MTGQAQTPDQAVHTDRLRQVLSAMGIKRACFVDDLYSPKFPAAFAASRAAGLAGRAAEVAAAWSCGAWTADSEDDDRTDAEREWERLDAGARASLLRTVQVLSPGEGSPTVVGFFADYWPQEHCPLEGIGPERFDEKYVHDSILGPGPSILFVDLSFGEEDQKGGLRLLEIVRKLDAERKTVCVVLTNLSGAAPQDAADFWDRLVADAKVDSSAAVVISKKSTESAAQFESELRRALLNALAPELLTWATTVADKALKHALAGLRVEGDVLNAVVLQSSEKEGIHPTETLFRLIDGGLRDARQELAVSEPALSQFAAIRAKLEQLSTLTRGDEGAVPLTARVRELRRSDLYRRLDSAAWPTPMWLGDLWRVALVKDSREIGEQDFVLVAQPCDIILRAVDGCRSQEWALLVPIKKEKGKHPETLVELKYFDAVKFEPFWAYLKQARVTSANVLDLVAIAGRKVSQATVSELRSLRHVHTSVAKRAQHLAVWLEHALSTGPGASALALFLGPGAAAKLTIADGAVEFHCERVGRIEPELSRLILQRYGDFVARHALPHDFADYER